MMETSSEQRMAELVETIRQDPSLPGSLLGQQAEIVRAALDGQSVYEIAQMLRVPEAQVWEELGNAARVASGQPIDPIETGGLGSE
jgi:DNA-binding NarL/FixJ family response regulator